MGLFAVVISTSKSEGAGNGDAPGTGVLKQVTQLIP